MAEKIKYSDLIGRISTNAGASTETIEELKKQMGIVMHEALEKDGSVHFSGLGTFYMKWSEAREGINPQTGERMEIKGHNHVSFRPDASVRRLINKEYENNKAFILDESGEKAESKIPKWIYAALAVLLISIAALLMNPREVIEEVVVVEEIEVPVIETVVVIEEVPVIETIVVIEEVVVVEEVFVTNEVPMRMKEEVEPPKTYGANDILKDIEAMPDANMTAPKTMKTGLDADIAAAEAGQAAALAEEAIADAQLAEAREAIAETSGPSAVSAKKVVKLEEKAEAADGKAMQAIADAMIADDVAEAAADQEKKKP